VDSPDITSAVFWLGWLNLVKNIGAILVVVGVAGELLGDWFSGPLAKKVEDARTAEIATLNNETARLSKEAETARASIADANARADVARAQALEASQKTEAERSERLKLEAQIAPRRLSPEQRDQLAAAWAPFSGQIISVVSYALDVESAVLGQQIIEVLLQAGAKPQNNLASIMPFGSFSIGIVISGPDRPIMDRLGAPLVTIGHLDVTGNDPSQKPTPNADKAAAVPLSILIGPKPPK
jgi:hypothetical protein